MASENTRPAHLEPSQLGTRHYWDNHYQIDLDLVADEEDVADLSDLESWFDDVNAPAKVLEYLTSEEFPLSPANGKGDCSIIDLGTGNGGMLFTLRLEGGFTGPMLGVDYSQQSVDLARRLEAKYLPADAQDSHDPMLTETPPVGGGDEQFNGAPGKQIAFQTFDLMHGDPQSATWWPSKSSGFDLVLDKGTFDAISLSSDTIESSGRTKRIHELYPRKIVDLIAPGGYFLLTSCNWTEDELSKWFVHGEGLDGVLEVFAKIRYPVYQFGGQQGQGVTSICFRRKT